MMSMDVTLQRQDLLEIANRASNFQDSMLRLRTDENRLIISATGRTSPAEPISKVVPDTLLPAVVSIAGTANSDPAELARQTRSLTAVRTRFVGISVWPGFELTGFDPGAPAQPVTPEPVTPQPVIPEPVTLQPDPSVPAPVARPVTFDMSPHVAALIDSRVIRIRKPWTVPVFGILTLGIYLFVWYYHVNRELRDLGTVSGEPGRRLDVKPGRSTLAVSLGALLIVPLIVSINHTLHRIQNAQRLTNTPGPEFSTGKAWGLFVLILPFWTAYAQGNLNRIWHEQLHRSLTGASTAARVSPDETDGGDEALEIPVPNNELWPVLTAETVAPEAAPSPPEPPPVPVLASVPHEEPSPPPLAAPAPPVPPAPVPVLTAAPPEEPLPSEPAAPLPAAPTPVPVLTSRPPEAPVAAEPPPPPPPPPPPAPVPVPSPRVVEPAPAPTPDIHDPAIETIRGRYARGEITRQEYRDLLEDLA